MGRRSKLDAALECLIREEFEGDEIILDWSDYRPGEIHIRLISAEMHRMCAPIANKFGNGAGTGRTLEFKQQDDQWVFQGTGG